MVDHSPNDDTVLRQPARILADDDMTLGPQGIAEMLSGIPAAVGAQPAAPKLYTDECSNCGCATMVSADAVAAIQRDAIEALTAKNQRLTDALNKTVQEATAAIDDMLKPEIERLTAENARLTSALTKAKADRHSEWQAANKAEAEAKELRLQCLAYDTQAHEAYEAQKRAEAEVERLKAQLGKYSMPPWEADHHKGEALAARRALCLGEHSQNVAPADIYDRIVALRTANETRREDVR